MSANILVLARSDAGSLISEEEFLLFWESPDGGLNFAFLCRSWLLPSPSRFPFNQLATARILSSELSLEKDLRTVLLQPWATFSNIVQRPPIFEGDTVSFPLSLFTRASGARRLQGTLCR